MAILLIGTHIFFFSDLTRTCYFICRAIAFCEKNFGGKLGDATKLETPLDQSFVAQITYELNVYLEAMEETR